MPAISSCMSTTPYRRTLVGDDKALAPTGKEVGVRGHPSRRTVRGDLRKIKWRSGRSSFAHRMLLLAARLAGLYLVGSPRSCVEVLFVRLESLYS
jgi:hypothetical protein